MFHTVTGSQESRGARLEGKGINDKVEKHNVAGGLAIRGWEDCQRCQSLAGICLYLLGVEDGGAETTVDK